MGSAKMLVIEQFWWDLKKKDENQHFDQCSHEITYKNKKKIKIKFITDRPTLIFFGNVSGNSTLIFFGLTLLSLTQNIGTPFGLFVRKWFSGSLTPSRPSAFFLCIPLNITLRYSEFAPYPPPPPQLTPILLHWLQ